LKELQRERRRSVPSAVHAGAERGEVTLTGSAKSWALLCTRGVAPLIDEMHSASSSVGDDLMSAAVISVTH
jgi:hypothetical protein